ncbi:MAG TPA: Holliday junction resolvase RuvX [Saprospiraceae bacterium]|nr:Holliday junction resolvase RuvX [Saprospiraceae bacterium]
MSRILAIDYGLKRSGIAVTDPLQIIVSPLTTIPTPELFGFLKDYFAKEDVELMVIGEPKHADGQPTYVSDKVHGFVRYLQKELPQIPIALEDESFSSAEAMNTLVRSGAKKKKRREKGTLDKISAAIILERYLQRIGKY